MQRDRQPGTQVHREKVRWGHSKRAATYKPRRAAPGENNPSSTSILDF